MRGVPGVSTDEALLERGDELEEIRAALESTGRGRGGVVAIEGGAGTGKSSLMRVAVRSADASGLRVLQARGSEYLTGVQALTPSELRVARRAAAGQSNKEIAQSLIVTKKTVADHLRATYRKLGVARREELARALNGAPSPRT